MNLTDHFSIEDHGSIVLLRPKSLSAKTWMTHRTDADSIWFDEALVVEPRYLEPLLGGFAAEILGGCDT